MTDTVEAEEVSESHSSAHTMPDDANSVLSDLLTHRGWDQREGQILMNRQIAETISLSEGVPFGSYDVSVSAPVGTGKSLAEMLPGIVAGRRMIVATSTKRLQDQLVKEELPQLQKDLQELYGYNLTYGVLKGRSNYACVCRIRKVLSGTALDDDEGIEEEALFDDLELDTAEAYLTDRDKDILNQIVDRFYAARESEDPLLYDNEALLSQLSEGTRRLVIGGIRCPKRNQRWVDADGEEVEDSTDPRSIATNMAHHAECVYPAAYAHAMESQVIVLNTTLLVYEIIRAMNPIMVNSPSVLRGRDMVVVDEAHHLPTILAEAYSTEVNFTELEVSADKLARKLHKRYGESGSNYRKSRFAEISELIGDSIDSLDGLLDEELSENDFRLKIANILFDMTGKVQAFINTTKDYAIQEERENPSGLKLNRDGYPKLIGSLLWSFGESISEVSSLAGSIARKVEYETTDGEERRGFANFMSEIPVEEDQDLIIKTVPVDVSHWRGQIERVARDENPFCVEGRESFVAALSSGTITKHTPISVGMRNERHMEVPSPFDHSRVRIYVPSDNNYKYNSWISEMMDDTVPVIQKLGGRSMILSTSRNAARKIATALRERLPEYDVLSQTDQTMFAKDFQEEVLEFGEDKVRRLDQSAILSEFVAAEGEKKIIVGLKSYWEGIDLPGKTLSMVSVDKPMMPTPDDPIFQALSQWVERQGRNAFIEVQCNFAAIMLAQGWGRLIRTVNDAGILMLHDSRVLDTNWGRSITKLVPKEWVVTRSHDELLRFTDWLASDDWSEVPDPDMNVWEPIRGKDLVKERLRRRTRK